ncbi:hypotheical conserved protein [Halarchaeum acidiphilum MH1-52-1]|uniref:Hypotheical conserved protein n=1 Tax=Halarchaeum acidiphilum MH1-52-1 TaxID=1261545 RepID=U2YF15_9EURY|nr:OB-fold domain-containing protein [Halarchaeum acidiphilum]GAD52521.1 hypotheical conserved protein [Halarchaeum acidiphilum MH1-52-1]
MTEYETWLGAVDAGDGYALACPDGHRTVPPVKRCFDCGAPDLERVPIPDTGTVLTATTVHVAIPDYDDDAPYTVAIADFDGLRLTGRVCDSPDAADSLVGRDARLGAETDVGSPYLTLRAE